MALKKTSVLPSGVSGEYWKITAMSIDFLRKQSTVSVALYLDQAARLAGKMSLQSSDVDLSGDAFPFAPASSVLTPLAIAYDALKALPAFTGSTDV